MTEEKIAELAKGETLEVVFTDPGAKSDLEVWCRATGHAFGGFKEAKPKYFAYIRKN